MFSISKNYITTCHCHLSSRFLILWRLSNCCFPFSTSFLFDIFTWKTIFRDSWVFNAKWINNKELSLNTLLYVSVRYTNMFYYVTVWKLFGNCIIVCHMFLELYSLYCNDLHCPVNNLNAPQRLVWASFDLKPSMEPLKWRNIHDLYRTDTSLIRTLCSVPSVSVLEWFDCSSKYINLSSL